jgi:asparagine synthase (glutamine-hydrolysing)
MAALYDASMSCLQNSLRADFLTTLPEDYLVKSDRASMRHSLELRAPFLGYQLVEFAFCQVPDWLKATRSQNKILLRNLAQRVLPPALDLKRKQGFTLPLAAWFQGKWGGFIQDVLLGPQVSIFNKHYVEKLISGQRRGLANTERLFSLTMFELWRREYNVAI